MSGLILNVETALPPPSLASRKRSRGSEGGEGSKKHQRFVRRRPFLERKGFLRQKQLPGPPGGRKAEEEAGRRPRKGQARAKGGGGGGGGGSSGAGLVEGEGGPVSTPIPAKPRRMVAIDCEMVGTGPGGRESGLARCSVVSYQGEVVYDRYIRPLSPITNYRTRWSGIRRHHMRHAIPFQAAQKEILKLLSGKIVVGHAIHNDFKALKYFHPKSLTRDTSRIPLLNRKAGLPENETASLKRLTKQLLHRDIQVGQNGHSSVEDARATMELYKVIEVEWERHLASCPPQD